MARPVRCRASALVIALGVAMLPALLAADLAGAPTAQAATSSAVTVTAADQDPDVESAPFPDLSVTVSQTQNLIAQGVRISYSGGVQSTLPSNTGGANFLQIMQCWGDLEDDAGNPVLDAHGNPQPDRTTCQYGGLNANGATRDATLMGPEYIPEEDAQYGAAGSGFAVPTQVSIPFRAVNGDVLQRITDGVIDPDVDMVLDNKYFSKYTTNEIDWAGFGASGAGDVAFEVQTNAQAPGLGCGQPIEQADGSVVGQPCWLVVLPRGTADWGQGGGIVNTGLLYPSWQHRLAVRLDFKALGVRCAIGAEETSLFGSELVAAAVSSWQPKLCTQTNGAIYNLIVTNEADELAIANDPANTTLALTTRALDTGGGSRDALTYAPVAITGIAIAFAIDHSATAADVPDDVKALNNTAFTHLNLTPRLLAKLLTNSYKNSLPAPADKSHLGDNPADLTKDPDFLAINDPAWAYQVLNDVSLADALVPLGRSDTAYEVWRYVLSDQEAVSFLAGVPDPWGMVVNPYGATEASVNPTGTPATYPKDSFPKADPTEWDYQKTPDPYHNSVVNVVGWRPYANDLQTAGYYVLRGDGRVLGDWDTFAIPPKFATAARRLPGFQETIGLTDTSSAATYTLYTASLRNPAGKFVAPTATSMAAAAAAMSATDGQSQVKELDYTSAAAQSAAGAYPLTVPVYAAANASTDDASSRATYAAFITYAATAGQEPGTDDGQLPAGYAPLPATWVAEATKAAAAIATGPTPSPTPSPSPTSTTPAPSSSGTPVTVSRAAGASDVVAEPPAGAQEPETTAPVVSGEAAAPVVGAATPQDPDIGALRVAVPVGAAGGLLAALGVPLVSRIHRRP